MDPRAELQAATERNAREAREEREAEELRAAAAKAAQEEAEESAKAQADAAAKAQAEAAAAETAAEALLVVPLHAVAPEIPEPPPEEAGGDLPGMEREEDDVVVREREATPPSPTRADRGGRLDAPPVRPAGGEPAAKTDLVVRSSSRQRAGKATSAPDQ